MMYQLHNDLITNASIAIKNLNNGKYIPFDPANRDYQEYLAWLAEGNEPLPADEPAQ